MLCVQPEIFQGEIHNKFHRRSILTFQEAEMFSNFIQREVAEYGDEDGTRANKAKTTLENCITRYYTRLGKAVAQKNARKC